MLEDFKANNNMLGMIVLLFMLYDDRGRAILIEVTKELQSKGLS